MKHPIQNNVRKAGDYTRRAAFTHAIGMTILSLVTLVAVLTIIDYFLRIDALRYLAFALTAGVALFAIWYWIIPLFSIARGRENTDILFARMIERREPQLRDRLSTAIQSLANGTADSEFASRLTAEVGEQLSIFDFRSLVNHRKLYSVLILLVAAMLIGTVVFATAPRSSGVALKRIAMPWANADWPTQNHLIFENAPNRISAGSVLELVVYDSNSNRPDAAELQIRFRDELHLRFAMSQDAEDPNRFDVTISGIDIPLEYRAVGGDSVTKWFKLDVAPGPVVEQLTWSVSPPAYSRVKSFEGTGAARVLKGSLFRVIGKCDRKIKQATLFFESEGSTSKTQLKLDSGGRSFRQPAKAAITADSSGEFWIEVVDENSVATAQPVRWPLTVIKDRKPATVILNPPKFLIATRQFVFPINVELRDDFFVAAASIELNSATQKNADPAQWTIPLPRPDQQLITRKDSDGIILQFTQDVAFAKALKEGRTASSVILTVGASDGNSALSRTDLKFQIVSEKEILQFFESETDITIRKLLDARKLVSEFHRQLQRLTNSENFEIEEIRNGVRSGMQLFHRFESQVHAGPESCLRISSEIISGLVRNNVSLPIWSDSLQATVQNLNEIEAISKQLNNENVAMTELFDLRDPNSPGFRRSIDGVINRQVDRVSQILERFDSIEVRFADWIDSRVHVQSLQEIRKSQIALLKSTTSAWQSLISSDKDPGPDDKLAATRMSRRQLNLFRELNRIIRNLNASARSSDSKNSDSSQISFASSKLQTAAAQMENSKIDLAGLKFSRSIQLQNGIVSNLQLAIDVMTSSEHADAAQLRQARAADLVFRSIEKLARLNDNVANLKSGNPLRDKEHDERLSQHNKMKAEVDGSLRELTDWLRQNDFEPTAQTIDRGRRQIDKFDEANFESLEDAITDLQKKLDRFLNELDSEATQNARARLYALVGNSLRSISDRQQALNREFAVKNDGMNLELNDRRAFTGEQIKIGEAIDRVFVAVESMVTIELFREQLQRAANATIDRMKDNQFGPETEAAMRYLKQKLDEFAQVFAPSSQNQKGNETTENKSNRSGAGIDSVELGLIFVLQKQLVQDTSALAAVDIDPSQVEYAEHAKRVEDLATRQSKLGQMLQQLLQSGETGQLNQDKTLPEIPDF